MILGIIYHISMNVKTLETILFSKYWKNIYIEISKLESLKAHIMIEITRV